MKCLKSLSLQGTTSHQVENTFPFENLAQDCVLGEIRIAHTSYIYIFAVAGTISSCMNLNGIQKAIAYSFFYIFFQQIYQKQVLFIVKKIVSEQDIF